MTTDVVVVDHPAFLRSWATVDLLALPKAGLHSEARMLLDFVSSELVDHGRLRPSHAGPEVTELPIADPHAPLAQLIDDLTQLRTQAETLPDVLRFTRALDWTREAIEIVKAQPAGRP